MSFFAFWFLVINFSCEFRRKTPTSWTKRLNNPHHIYYCGSTWIVWVRLRAMANLISYVLGETESMDFNQLNAPYYPTTIPTVLGEPPNNIILTSYRATCQAFALCHSEVIVFGLIFFLNYSSLLYIFRVFFNLFPKYLWSY